MKCPLLPSETNKEERRGKKSRLPVSGKRERLFPFGLQFFLESEGSRKVNFYITIVVNI